jgi:uncharacterized coiled-coil protein SlyX
MSRAPTTAQYPELAEDGQKGGAAGVSELDDIRRRVEALETEVAGLRDVRGEARRAADLFAMVDRDVADLNAAFGAQRLVLQALRDTQLEQGRSLLEFRNAQAEQGRTLVDQGRTLAEQGRTLAEQSRTLAEQSRTLAEQGRTLAEQGRTLAEQGTTLADLGRTQTEQGRTQTEHGQLLRQILNRLGDPGPEQGPSVR